jgi:dolichol-phosphate mannosyltransferase
MPKPQNMPPFAGRRSVVVLPTFNEAGNVVDLLEKLMASPANLDVVVVDDESPDGTAEAAEKLAEIWPGRIEVLVRSGPRGLGWAYQYGFEWVRALGAYDTVICMDADGSHPVSTIPALIAALGAPGPDRPLVAVASRYAPGGSTPGWPLRRRVLSRTANVYARTLTGLASSDVTGSFRAWDADLLLNQLQPETCEGRGFAFVVELLVRAERCGASMVEVPYAFYDRILGESKMGLDTVLVGAATVWSMRRPSLGGKRRAPVALSDERMSTPR